MKNIMKKVIKLAFVAAFVAVAGYGVYTNQTSDAMSDLVLANIDAQADNYEIGDWGTNWKEYETMCTFTETITIGWDFMLQVAITKSTTTTAKKSVCGSGGGWCLSSAGC